MHVLSKLKRYNVFIVFIVVRKLLMLARAALFLRVYPRLNRKFYLGVTPKVFGLKKIKLPERFSFGDHLWMETISQYGGVEYNPYLEIGENFTASDYFHIGCVSKIVIGANVLVGSKVHITDHAHGIYEGCAQSTPYSMPIQRMLPNDGFVVIGDNVWIGDGVVVLPNTNIGNGAIVGANSVVSRDVPANVMVVGAPAKIIKKWNDVEGRWIRV